VVHVNPPFLFAQLERREEDTVCMYVCVFEFESRLFRLTPTFDGKERIKDGLPVNDLRRKFSWLYL